MGPTVCITWEQGRLYAPVMRARPGGSSPPSIISAHSARSCTPAYVCIALSMHPWHGEKHPSIPPLAALTMASHLSVVMSPRQTHMPSPNSRESASTIPFLSVASRRYASCTSRTSASVRMGGRTFISERRSLHLPSGSEGTSTRAPTSSANLPMRKASASFLSSSFMSQRMTIRVISDPVTCR